MFHSISRLKKKEIFLSVDRCASNKKVFSKRNVKEVLNKWRTSNLHLLGVRAVDPVYFPNDNFDISMGTATKFTKIFVPKT